MNINYLLISFINLFIQVFSLLVLVEVIASWVLASGVRVPEWGYNLLRIVHTLTAPILNPIRRFMPNMGGLDFSPIIALLLLQVLGNVLVSALQGRY